MPRLQPANVAAARAAGWRGRRGARAVPRRRAAARSFATQRITSSTASATRVSTIVSTSARSTSPFCFEARIWVGITR